MIIYRIVGSLERILLQYAKGIIPRAPEIFRMSLLTMRVQNVSAFNLVIIISLSMLINTVIICTQVVLETIQQDGMSVVFSK